MTSTRATGSRRVLITLLVAVAIFAAACGSKKDNTDSAGNDEPAVEDQGRDVVDEGAPEPGGTLIVGVSGESDGWTPQTNTFADAGSMVIASVVEPLAKFNPEGEPEPYLAESWEPNEDFTEWTIKIREGVTFHDGEPLNADAVVTNMQHAVDSPLVGIALKPQIESIEAVDEFTVLITTKNPFATLPGTILTLQPGQIVSPNMFEEEFFGASHPVGTGPFVFDEWIQDDHFSAIRNDDYWRKGPNGEDLPYLDKIEFRVIVDGSSRAQALEAGDIDLMYTTRPADIAAYRTSDDVTVIEDNQTEETLVQLNEAVPPFDNEHARRAAALAIDTATVNAVLGEGVTKPITGPWAENEPFYNPEPGYVTFDLEAAKEEVAAYKADTGEDLAFTLKGLPSVDDAELLQLLTQMWDEAGIDVEIVNVEQTVFITDLAFGNFEASFFRNFSFTDPDAHYVFLHSSQANYPDNISINFTNTKVDEIDALLDDARREGDRTARNLLYRELVPAINAELPYIWLFNTPYALVSDTNVHGLNAPREIGFGNYEIKWWLGDIWIEQ